MVVDQPSAGKQNDPSAICSLSALERKTWAAIREEILGKGGAAAASLGLMESAVLTLCLEDCNAPSTLADILNAVRLGGGGDSPCLRYYDKVWDSIWIWILKQLQIRWRVLDIGSISILTFISDSLCVISAPHCDCS